MAAHFAYAKPTQFRYHSFSPEKLQYTNVPLSSSVPEPPAFAKQDTADAEKDGEKTETGAQNDQPPASKEKTDPSPGQLTFSRPCRQTC